MQSGRASHISSTYSPVNFIDKNSSMSSFIQVPAASQMVMNLSSLVSTIEVSMTESAWTAGDLDSDLILHSFYFLPSVTVMPFRYLSIFSLITETAFSAFRLCSCESFQRFLFSNVYFSCSWVKFHVVKIIFVSRHVDEGINRVLSRNSCRSSWQVDLLP